MTTTTKDLKAKFEALTPEDKEKASALINASVGAITVAVLGFKARRAAKHDDWAKAIYYAVTFLGGQAGLRYRLDELRRKGFIK